MVYQLNIFIINDPQQIPRKNISYLRSVHLSPNAPAVNIRVNSRNTCKSLRYKEISRYARLNPETYDITVLTAIGNKKVLEIKNQVLQSAFYQTVYILGLSTEEAPLEAIIPLDSMYKFIN